MNYKAPGSNFEYSLVKLTGKKIRDIYGHPTTNVGDTAFLVTRIVFDDLSEIWLGGEHDCPYLEIIDPTIHNLDTNTLDKFLEQEQEDADRNLGEALDRERRYYV